MQREVMTKSNASNTNRREREREETGKEGAEDKSGADMQRKTHAFIFLRGVVR